MADLLRHGLLHPSFIPPQPIRVLRDLTRYRKSLVEQRTQQINRIHKVLETANIKLGAVASNVVGASGRRMLEAIEHGEADPQVLAELAKGRLREKLPALRLALAGRVQAHHRLLIGELLDHLEYLERAIHRVEVSIAELLTERERAVRVLLTLPATGSVTAAAIIAEIGTDMRRFESRETSLLVGRGLSGEQAERRQTEERGHDQRQHPARGHPVRNRGQHRSHTWHVSAALYHRIARRRGKPRAMIAVAHSLLVSIYFMLRDQVPYQELGPDYFDRLQGQQLERHYVCRLEALGFTVTLTPAAS